MLPRHQLPVYSPLPGSAVRAGLNSCLSWTTDALEELLNHLTDRTGTEDGILTDSGTSALRLTLEALVRTGRAPVALPAYSCYDLASAAVGAQAPVVLYDIDPSTLSPDLESLRLALRSGARSIVVAPLLGFPIDWEAVTDLAESEGVLIVEDAAQGHGSEYRGRGPGTEGDLVVMSFGRGKGWTGGGGGALLFRSSWHTTHLKPPHRLRRQQFGEVSTLITTAAQWVFGRPALYGIPRSLPFLGLGRTDYQEPRRVARMSSISVRIALATRSRSEREIELRRLAADQYRALLVGTDNPDNVYRAVQTVPGGTNGYLRFPVLVAFKRGTNLQIPRQLRVGGVERLYPQTLAQLPALQSLLARPKARFPGAETLARSLVSMPTHSKTKPVERVALVQGLLTWVNELEAARALSPSPPPPEEGMRTPDEVLR